MTRWNHLTREQAKRLGIEGFWELQQMEKEETKSLEDKVKGQEEEEDND